MSLEYVRKYYGVPAKRGRRIEWYYKGVMREGTITRATHNIFVRFDGAKHSVPIHPTDSGLKYLSD